VFTALGLGRDDLDQLNDVLGRFRETHGDFPASSERTQGVPPEGETP
jgi:hypothetical protein